MEGGQGCTDVTQAALGPVGHGQEGQGSPDCLAKEFSMRIVRETAKVSFSRRHQSP